MTRSLIGFAVKGLSQLEDHNRESEYTYPRH